MLIPGHTRTYPEISCSVSLALLLSGAGISMRCEESCTCQHVGPKLLSQAVAVVGWNDEPCNDRLVLSLPARALSPHWLEYTSWTRPIPVRLVFGWWQNFVQFSSDKFFSGNIVSFC